MAAAQFLIAYPRATILATFTGSGANQTMNTLLGTKSYFTDNRFFMAGTATSASTGSYALISGTNYAGPTNGGGSWIRFVNQGLVVGAAGAGGAGGHVTATLAVNNGAAGAGGGPAFQAQRFVSIDNSAGRIYGGGGGGGGGGGRASVPGFSGQAIGGAGGGGGGGGGYFPGAGAAGGTGNISNDSFPVPGVGTWTAVQADSGNAGSGTLGGAGGARTECIYGTGGDGGGGGNAGAAGAHGGDGAGGLGSLQGTGGNGGAAGQYINGTANVVWISTGDVKGGAA